MVAKERKDSLVLSASRTKDLVRCGPSELAKVILGERTCRFGLARQHHTLTPRLIHTLVLWTKSPHNILYHQQLNGALNSLIKVNGQVALHVSITGFGSSFVEMGIPHWVETLRLLKEILASKLVRPELVTLRYDPLLRLKFDDWTISNCSLSLFEDIISAGAALGIRQVVTSACDLINYQRAAKRFTAANLKAIGPTEEEAIELVTQMARACHERNVAFSVCCYPEVDFNEVGCINGRLYNSVSLREDCCTEKLHNVIGSQRKRCLCTHSRDIGYSKGFTHCFSQGAGCIYCYSQGATLGKLTKGLLTELDRLRKSDDWWENDSYRHLVER